MHRGFLRLYMLKLIAKSESPISGYDLMKQIEDETGFWRPSPGSTYPILAALEEAKFIEHSQEGDRKLYTATAAGKDALAHAHDARAEAMQGVHRSLHIVGELFGAQTPEELALLTEHAGHKSRIAPELRRSLKRLRVLLHALLMQDLSAEQSSQVKAAIDRAIKELRQYVKSD